MGSPQRLAWLGQTATDEAELAAIQRHERMRRPLWARLVLWLTQWANPVPDAFGRLHL